MGFDVMGVLGRGGATVVELAVDGNGERVAAKRVVLTGSARQIEIARRRLRREAEVVRKLAHPGIVPVLGLIEQDNELILLFPVMEESLDDRVSRLGPLVPSEVARVGQVLLSAVATAHRHGVVHRDIKPSNVLFDASGRPALSDFGAATSWELTSGLTPDGTVIGTPMWMAPEQARGEPTSTASDVFSLGATLAYAATGREPYGSGPPAVVMGRAARGEIQELPESIPPELRIPLQCMLDPLPGRRPSAAAALGGLDGTIESPVPTLEERPARGSHHPPIRRRAIIAAAGAVAAVTSVALGVAVSAEGSSPSRASSASEAVRAVPAPPHTRGGRCDPGWYDLNGISADGCEAHSDYTAGALTPDAPIHANLVPTSAVDSFTTHVTGDSLSLCWGSLHVTLTAPAEAAERLILWKGTTQVAQALSANGAPATATVKKPSCFGADSEDLRVTIAAVASTGGASANDFTLSRDGGW